MTPPPTFGANSAAARDIAHVLHPYTDLKAHQEHGPMIISHGKGVRVWDENGKGYIESVAGLWCASLGFSNERLVEAAAAQMRKLPFYHAFTAKSHEPVIDLSEMLIARAPVPMSKVFFANSGSEANDTAIKMVWYFNNAIGRPKKKKLIGRIKGYHGITLAAASLTGLPYNHRSFDVPLPGFVHTMTPHYYHGALPGESEDAFATRCADELEKLILAEDPDTVAAMWAEPIMGAGGVIVPPRGYYEKIQAVLRKYDVLFVADEVICGFGRTGNYWGSQTMNMQPDILTCAKALSSSYLPISAVMVNERVFQGLADESHAIGTFGHGYTYSGHPVPAAVAIETLKIYDEMDIVGHVREVGPYLQSELRRRFADHELVGEVRGTGLIGARLVKLCEANGVIGRALPNDSLAFSPPLIITAEEIGEMLDGVGRALDELTVQLRREQIAIVS
jgi:4-aminobutyrate--pyruvate transaminase